MTSDLRQALRSLRRAPWYSATVIGVIALGVAPASRDALAQRLRAAVRLARGEPCAAHELGGC
jgi:hypothetical protein